MMTATDQSKKATASGWIGSVLEYYDFFIYAQAAALVFPQIFFPQENPQIAIIASLATYGVGYIARPIGALFLGHWGDTRGRKNVLLVCMFMMGIATMAVGVLPTYSHIGLWAPALLVVLRLVQGFAVAGEIAGASSMILEHAPFGRRGYYASFTTQGVQAGQILAAGIFLPLSYYMSPEAFTAWGWRIPFLLSAVVLLAGFFIRREVHETPAFVTEEHNNQLPHSPINEVFATSWRTMILVACMAATNIIPAVTTIFGAAYAVQPAYGIGFDKNLYLWIPMLGNVCAVLMIPYVGKLSDQIGRRPLAIAGPLGGGVLSFAYLYAIQMGSIVGAFVISMLMWGVVYQLYNGTFPSFFPELFKTRYRVTGMAVSLGTGVTVSALMPAAFAMMAPPGSQHIPLLVGGITFLICAIAAGAASLCPETFRLPIESLGESPAQRLSRQRHAQHLDANDGPTSHSQNN